MSFAPDEFADSPFVGMDVSWIAMDDDGHVAWLVTFGSAVMPRWVEERFDDFEIVEGSLGALPERDRERRWLAALRPQVSNWRATALRGVFVYDWEVYSGPYRLLESPRVPLTVAQLPDELARLARRTRFSGLCFRERPELHVRDVLACEPEGSAPS